MMRNILTCGLILLSIYSDKVDFSVEDLTGKSKMDLHGDGYKLQKEVSDAFILMKNAALKSGIQIHVISSYRSYEHQKRIWTRKYNQFIKDGLSQQQTIRKIIEYSTIPGTSRHHWGTDLDIIDSSIVAPNDVLNTKHFEGIGVYVKLKKWLEEHADEFGFCLVYTNNQNRKGFKYEPWHYSYKPISKNMLTQYQKIDIQTLLKKDKLLGSSYFTDEFITKYINENILDINSELKD